MGTVHGTGFIPETTSIRATTRAAAEETKIFTKTVGENHRYREIFQNQRMEFRDFLKNIFMQLDEDRFFKLIDSILLKDLTDQQVYTELCACIGEAKKGKVQTSFAILRSLRELKAQLSDQVEQLMGKGARVNGYAEIGYPGRMIRPIQSKLDMSGPILVINDQERITDFVETGFPRPYNKFVPLNNFEPILESAIPTASLDMVTCFIGLHHTPKDKLAGFIESIHRVLRPGGSFILMDHDVKTKALHDLVWVVHSVFNAAFGVAQDKEEAEVRDFNSLEHWSSLLEEKGFVRTNVGPFIREGDSTQNSLVRFTKKVDSAAGFEQALMMQAGYHRAQMQTYLTGPEWQNVRSAQAYSKFIEHTPFYQFPYINELKTFWTVYLNSWNAARQHASFSEVAFSQYNLMNLFIGVSMTIEYLAKAIVSAPIAWFYGSEEHKEAETIDMLVKRGTVDVEAVDGRIEVVESGFGLEHIRVPRYMPFLEIVQKLARYRVEIINIAGQKRVQFDVRVKAGGIGGIAGAQVIGETDASGYPGEKYLYLDVPVEKISGVVAALQVHGIPIEYIHDF